MSQIVSIHSFRGGTGKSNITANLALVIASSGKRVGIVDTDIQSPGIHVLFGLDETKLQRSLNDYLWGQCSIDEAAYDVGSTLKTSDGTPALTDGSVHLVPSSIRAGEIARILREHYDVGLLNDGFYSLIERLRLDYLFVDTHPGLDETTLASIALSDLLLILLRPDGQDYQGTAVTVEVARKLDVSRMLLVVNKALSAVDPEALRQQIEQSYQVPVAGILPLSEEVADVASFDVFCLRYPGHPWTQTVRAIAAKLDT